MRKRNPLLFFSVFIIFILSATVLSAAYIKHTDDSMVFFNSLYGLTTWDHQGKLSLVTLGDAAIIDHQDLSIDYVSNDTLQIQSKENNALARNFIDLRNALYGAPDGSYQMIHENFWFIKGQLEKDLNFRFQDKKVLVTFTLEEAYTSFVNLLDLLSDEEAFQETYYYAFNTLIDHTANNHMVFQALIDLMHDFENKSLSSFDIYYQSLIKKFSKDSVITLEFTLDSKDQIGQIMCQADFIYMSFQASEWVQWYLEF